MRSCLDSWAVLRWLEGGEPAATRVQELLESRPFMSWINVGEVFYVSWRSGGQELAGAIIDDLRRSLVLDEPSPERVLQAAAVRAEHPMAYADAFAVATAKAHGATLVTGHPEILEAATGCRTEDLR